MSTLRNIVIFAILAVLLRDVIVKVPGWIVGAVDTIGNMPAKRVAIIILIVAGIYLLLKRKK